jgi:type II secretion system protein H
MRPHPQAREAAFTLTELLVVLLLIGIFTGIMLAEMRGTFEDALLRSGARDIMSGLSLASSRAITLNQPHAFEWDGGENQFTVRTRAKSRDSSESEDPVESKKIDERLTIEIRDPAEFGESEEAPNAPQPPRQQRDTIQFYPDSTADAREIILRDNNNGELVLRINPVTGRVRVQEEEPR